MDDLPSGGSSAIGLTDEHAEKCRREWQAGKRAKHGQQSMFGFFSKAPAQPAAQNACAANPAAAPEAAAPEVAAPETIIDGVHADASLPASTLCHCCVQKSALMGESKWCGSMAWCSVVAKMVNWVNMR
jgi:hypothetical protein